MLRLPNICGRSLQATMTIALIAGGWFLFSSTAAFAAQEYLDFGAISINPPSIEVGSTSLTIQATISSVYGVSTSTAALVSGKSISHVIPLSLKADSSRWEGTIDTSKFPEGAYAVVVRARSNRKGSNVVASTPVSFSVTPPLRPTARSAANNASQNDTLPTINTNRSSLKESYTRYASRFKQRKKYEYAIRTAETETQKRIHAKIKSSGIESYRYRTNTAIGVQPTPFLQNFGPISDKLNVVFLGINLPQDGIEDIARHVIGKGFQMYSPFRERWSAMNFWVARDEGAVRASPGSTDTNLGDFIDRFRSQDGLGIIADQIIVLAPNTFRSYAIRGNNDAFVSLGNAQWSVRPMYEKNRIIALAMHEFGHSFGGLADEYIEPLKGSNPNGINCESAITAPQYWIDNANNLDWSYSQSGSVPVKAGMWWGCSYIDDNRRSTDRSTMNDQDQNEVPYDPGRITFPPYGWVNRHSMGERLEAYEATYGNDGCGDISQWACGMTVAGTANNGLFCLDTATLYAEPQGNVCRKACGGMNMTPCGPNAIGMVRGCASFTAQVSTENGVTCQFCPANKKYIEGTCVSCGNSGQPTCVQTYGIDWKYGCRIPSVNSRNEEIYRNPAESTRIIADSRCTACPRDAVASSVDGRCHLCGRQNEPPCATGTTGTAKPTGLTGTYLGCYPPYSVAVYRTLQVDRICQLCRVYGVQYDYNNRLHTCINKNTCGKVVDNIEQPPCPENVPNVIDGCLPGHYFDRKNLVCRVCGHIGEVACPWSTPDTKNGCYGGANFYTDVTAGPAGGTCRSCGRRDEPACRSCGNKGQRPCPLTPEGLLVENSTRGCYGSLAYSILIRKDGTTDVRDIDPNDRRCTPCPRGTKLDEKRGYCFNPCGENRILILNTTNIRWCTACGKYGQPTCVADESREKSEKGCEPGFQPIYKNSGFVCGCMLGLTYDSKKKYCILDKKWFPGKSASSTAGTL